MIVVPNGELFYSIKINKLWILVCHISLDCITHFLGKIFR